MALSIDWGGTNTITVLQSDLTWVTGVLYDLDVDWFRLALKDLEDSEGGMPFPKTHDHNTTYVISGTTFARAIIVLAPYTVKFEDTGSAYTVRTTGANNNILDYGDGILTPTPLVSYASTNTAGLTEVGTSGLTSSEATDIAIARKVLTNRQELADGSTGNLVTYDDDDVSVLLTQDVKDESDGAISLGTGDPAKRSKGV